MQYESESGKIYQGFKRATIPECGNSVVIAFFEEVEVWYLDTKYKKALANLALYYRDDRGVDIDVPGSTKKVMLIDLSEDEFEDDSNIEAIGEE